MRTTDSSESAVLGLILVVFIVLLAAFWPRHELGAQRIARVQMPGRKIEGGGINVPWAGQSYGLISGYFGGKLQRSSRCFCC